MTAIQQIEADLTVPTDALIDDITRLDGDIMVLGVGGKVGPSVAIMARRAIEAAGVDKKVFGVARFSDPAARASLEEYGVDVVPADALPAPARRAA